MNAKSNAPIIIKRKKIVGGDGHHGGAWKVAYADFVTAMMAFFMLMWLLNATTEKQRKGIADYFSPTIPVNRISGGGDGSFGGDSVFSDETLSQNGAGRTGGYPAPMDIMQTDSSGGKAADPLQEVADILSGRGGESALPDETLRHIVTRVTDEGLVIEVFDLPDTPLFDERGTEPTETMTTIAAVLVDVFKIVSNEVAVNGHTRSHPIVLSENPVWDLSTARADRVRTLLEAAGLPGQRVQRVTGFADRKPAMENPMSVRNNRLELVLLRAESRERY